MSYPWLLFPLFLSFQTNITILQQMYVEKCPSSICRWDLNPRHSEHESRPIITRSGLPPNLISKYFVDPSDKLCRKNDLPLNRPPTVVEQDCFGLRMPHAQILLVTISWQVLFNLFSTFLQILDGRSRRRACRPLVANFIVAL